MNIKALKIHNVYFNFSINTNYAKRKHCYDALKTKIEWLENITPSENIKRLAQYKFCICPEGNGVDNHRLWEALYLKTVPIVINSEFSKVIKNYNIPVMILDDWSDLNIETLDYNSYNFDENLYNNKLSLEKIKESILED